MAEQTGSKFAITATDVVSAYGSLHDAVFAGAKTIVQGSESAMVASPIIEKRSASSSFVRLSSGWHAKALACSVTMMGQFQC